MAYSFTKIEKDKSSIIGVVFLFLIIFYIFILSGIFLFIQSFKGSMRAEKIVLNWASLGTLELALLICLGIAAAFLHYLISTYDLTRRVLLWLNAKDPDPKNDKEKVFLNIIEEVSIATGGTVFVPVIIPSLALNAFTLDDDDHKPVIGITQGALHQLSRAQMEAVVAHQAAHILKGDCFIATCVSSMFEFYTLPMRSVFSWRKPRDITTETHDLDLSWIRLLRFSTPIVLVYVVIVFVFYLATSMVAFAMRMLISRQAKFRADVIAVRLTRDPLSLAQAIRVLGDRWRGVGTDWEALQGIFFLNPQTTWIEEKNGFVSDWFSTHPPLISRINYLLELSKISRHELEISVAVQIEENYKRQKQNLVKSDIGVVSTSMVKGACPLGHGLLIEEKFENEILLKCPNCQGYLADENQMAALFHRRQFIPLVDHIDLAKKAMNEFNDIDWQKINRSFKQNGLLCPKCTNIKLPMQTRLFNAGYPLVIDKCIRCNSIWFDQNELAIIQAMYELKNPKKHV